MYLALKLLSTIVLAAGDSNEGCEVDKPSKATTLLQLKDEEDKQSGAVEEDEGIFGCRRRRRRRRRQSQTLNKKCWYQVWKDSDFEGSWLNYEMNDGLCDDLSAYAGGSYNNVLSAGLAGAEPGCQLLAHDASDCTGSSWTMADATSSNVGVTMNYPNFDGWSWTDKISSFYCSCSSSLLQQGERGSHTKANATHHTGDPGAED